MSDLAQALMVAIRVHAGQVDKAGDPYLLHVLRVVEAVSDGAKVVAALHDVVEDGDVMLPQVAAAARLSMDEHGALVRLTRMGERYAQYIGSIAGVARNGFREGEIAREVKLADLRDNLSRIPREPPRAESYQKDVWGGIEEVLNGSHDAWVARWASLKARYEKAIETLETATVVA